MGVVCINFRNITVGALIVALAACGGGGGGSSSKPAVATTGSTGSSSASGSSGSTGTGTGTGSGSGSSTTQSSSISVTPLTVNVTANANQAAPTATFVMTITGSASGIYLAYRSTKVGVASVVFDDLTFSTETVTGTITFQNPASLGVGTYQDDVQLAACYDQACTQLVTNAPQTIATTYTVTAAAVPPTPLETSIAPQTVTAASGEPITLTVNGSSFVSSSVVQFNGAALQTTYISPTQLTAVIPAADTTSVGTAPITVSNAAVQGGVSSPLTLTISASGPATLTTVGPSAVTTGGGAFRLTALGAGYTPSTVVYWNGSARQTTYVSATEVIAQILPTDIATGGTGSVTVANPSTSASAPLSVSITAASLDAATIHMDPAQTGVTTINNFVMPTTPAWSVSLVNTPNYSLVADGLVIVTDGENVEAFKQSTGVLAWGPIPFSGSYGGYVFTAYENGKVFVQSNATGNAAILTGLDAQTGTQLWSTSLAGQYFFNAGITARNGIVYSSGAGDGGTVYAISETNGATLWTAFVENGAFGVPAVTVDGVYVNYPCQAYDFNPLTGESVWHYSGACEGGGGATGPVANGVDYGAIAISGFGGDTFDSETGTLIGGYSADSIPAIDTTREYVLNNGTLQGISLSNNSILWSFAGDGGLQGAPIKVNGVVFIGSSSGMLYGIDAASGATLWSTQLSGGINYITSGDGLLVVPHGNALTTYVLSTQP